MAAQKSGHSGTQHPIQLPGSQPHNGPEEIIHTAGNTPGKAEHESGLPTAHYRYTRGKTRGSESPVITGLPGSGCMFWAMRVLTASTRETMVIYLFIILLYFGYLQFLFIEIFIGVITFENCNKIHIIHVNATTKWMLLQHCSCCCCRRSHYRFPLLPLPPCPGPCPCCGGSDVAAQRLRLRLSRRLFGQPPFVHRSSFVLVLPFVWTAPVRAHWPSFVLVLLFVHLSCRLFGQPPFVLTDLRSCLSRRSFGQSPFVLLLSPPVVPVHSHHSVVPVTLVWPSFALVHAHSSMLVLGSFGHIHVCFGHVWL
jgi:hypothetical protein